MRHCRNLTAYLGLLFVCVAPAARADVFYVDATSLNTVRASNGAADWFTGDDQTQTTGGNSAEKWKFRSGQGNNGIWEATNSSTLPSDAPLIKTTVTDAPLGTYDVYAFYRSTAGTNNWKIRAGLTEGTMSLYDRTGADGTAGLLPFTGDDALTFAPGTTPVDDTEALYYAVIGQATVTDGTLSVFLDDFPTVGLPGGTPVLENRTWYDGIGYFVDPSTLFINSAMSGPATTGSTWVGGLPPEPGKLYRVVTGHTVDVSSPFAGDSLKVATGGTVNFSSSGVDVRSLNVEAGGSLVESVSGDFALGDINAATLGEFQLGGDVDFNIDAGANFFLDMNLLGSGSLDVNGGAGSDLWLTSAGAFGGTIRFNGSGDEVRLTEATSSGFGTLEMNSTGANTLYYNPGVQADIGTAIFNQPGTIDHAATSTSPSRRLHGPRMLVANAAVTIDLTKGFPDDATQTDERRFLIGAELPAVSGSGDITVNGTAVDYSNGTSVSHHEFEVGSTGDPGVLPVSDYSGTFTANNFVDFEMRNHFPNARFVVNNNAQLEMGNQAIASIHSLQMGAVEINDGGTLEIGFEQTSGAGVVGHHAYKLTLTSEGTRDGSLTLADGATVQMQINGTTAGQFDSIAADGDVQLNGTLNVLVNPVASSGTNPTWTPVIGQTFDIISINSDSAPGDYDGNGTVETADHNAWAAGFGTTNAALDGNGNGVVDAADYTIWRDNLGATGSAGGTVMGTFDSVTVTNPIAGFAFQVNYSSTRVQLEVIASGAGSGTAVPEPSTLVLGGILLALFVIRRRNR
ncbi:MAG: PEP-CTERM sorting domain-containing protein [Pirellulales bacterium]